MNQRVTFKEAMYWAAMWSIGLGFMLWILSVWGIIDNPEMILKSAGTLLAVFTASASAAAVQKLFGKTPNKDQDE